MCDQIKLSLPTRKVPTGRFAASDDNEFLIIFKDSIGVFIPNLKLSGEKRANSTDCIGNRMAFFTLETSQSNFPILLERIDICPSHEVARFALSCCDRIAINMSSKNRESKDFQSHVFRNADWSPIGIDKMSRTVFSCVTGNRQLLICSRDPDKWICAANLSSIWNVFWRSRGLHILSEGRKEFLDLSDEALLNAQHTGGLDDFTVPLKCRSVHDFFSSVAESSIVISTWSRKFRKSEQKVVHCNSLLAALHKSGSISFWDVSVPLINNRNIRLAAVDRTYTVAFDPPTILAKPNFIRMFDIGEETLLLVVAFTDSRIVCVTYQAYAKQMGFLSIQRLNDSELYPCSSGLITVGDATYNGGVLAIAYGTRIILANVTNHTSVQILTCLSDESILKAITGVRIFKSQLYFSSQDGVIAKASMPTQLNKNYTLTMLAKAPTLDGKNFHRFFSGLHITNNEVYAAFLESTVAPPFCSVTSNLVFLGLLPNAKVVDMMDKLSAPMRRNADCLYEVARLLRSVECNDVDMDEETWSRKLIVFCKNVILNTEEDLSKLELHKIQFQRAVAMLLLEGSTKSTDMMQTLQIQIDRLDKILALRQIDKCYRLFLKTEVQRQSQDCVLVLRIAALCRQFLQGAAAATEVGGAVALCSVLRRASEAVASVALKLLTKRFNQSLDNVNTAALLICPVCKTGVEADLLVAACPRGHEFQRCISTFIPCVEPSFNECPSCRHCSVLLPDLPSQWRREVNGRFCPYCDVRFLPITL